jgi:CheY-like chemotaxis protein
MLGILRGHKAGLKIYSEVGRGSTFKVFFPAAQGQALPEKDVDLPAHATFQGTVLLVDDERAILQATTAALGQLGFSVLVAADGQEAMEAFQADLARIDLVIMDLTMPRMDGREAFQTMRRLKPDVKVILSSGYNEQESIQNFIGKGLAGFLQKPYTLDSLRRTIHRILSTEG